MTEILGGGGEGINYGLDGKCTFSREGVGSEKM